MAERAREEQFVQSLRDWGQVFMLTIWLQSIMTAAITTKVTGGSPSDRVLSEKYRKRRNDLMKNGLGRVWKEFVREFPGGISHDEHLTADMIILLRNQLAHCHISSRNAFALFIPTPSSQKLLDKLERAGRIETPDHDASNPKTTIMREGDGEWLASNTKMIIEFSENTILRLTRAHGIDDSEVCV